MLALASTMLCVSSLGTMVNLGSTLANYRSDGMIKALMGKSGGSTHPPMRWM